MYFLLGGGWLFHLLWTIWMIPQDQPDLQENGTFFSLVFIVLANCAGAGVSILSGYWRWSFHAVWREMDRAFLWHAWCGKRIFFVECVEHNEV